MNQSKSLALGRSGKRHPARASQAETRSFRDYYFQAIVRPRQTFDALVVDHRRVTMGLLAVSISAILYTVVYIGLTVAGGAPTVFEPWLAIPKEAYFRYDIFILAPSMFAGWILAAGVVQLLSRLAGGQGSFEDTLSVLGFGIGLATWATGIHELTDSVLGALGIINVNQYEALLNGQTFWHYLYLCLSLLYLGGMVWLFSKGIGAAQRIRPLPAFIFGVLAFLIYQFFFFIFNR